MSMTAATASIGRRPTVLIVDDVPNNLGVRVECLESAYRLVVAQDGHEGLARAALVKPDLILLDVMMPGMDGFEACRRLEQNPDTANPGYAETVAVYAKGDVIPNSRYALKDTPCEQVIAGKLCCYPSDVRRQFPKAALLEDLQVDSYAGLPLWDSTGALIGLIAVLDGKPFVDTAAVTSTLQPSWSRWRCMSNRRKSAAIAVFC